MNRDQLSAFRAVADGHNVIITGQCGTGKTYLLKCIIQELQKTKDVAVTSMTGMASLQLGLGATTIHHWSGIMDCRHTHEDLMILFDTDDRFQSAKTRIIKSNVLVIDEIGMMSKTVLEMLEFVCRYVRGNTSVFGGLQVIATGDFKQLPPVPNRRFDDDGSFCFLSPLFQKTFPHHINLQQVVRQNEEDLVQAIHELCDGDPSKETEQLLRRLSRPLHNAVDVVKLFGTNFDADYINHEMLNSIDGNDKVYKSVDEGEVKLLMHSAAPKNLLLKVGAPVILIRNLEHNLFNGTRGVVTKLTEEGPVISVSGKNVPVPLTKFEVYDKTKKVTLATRLQYPVKLAFALTVHRAQGQTIPYLEVDCFSFFSPGQMGVAIGRAVNKKGLRVVNYNSAAAHLKHPGEVYDFYHQQILDFAQDLSCCRHTVDEDTSTLSQKSSEDYDNEEPYESPSSDSEADINLHRQCPWDVKEFLELNKGSPCVSDKPSGFGETEILKKHVQYLYAKVLEVMAKELKKSSEWTGALKELNTFLVSDFHLGQCQKLFKCVKISKSQNKFSTKLCMWLFEKETDQRSQMIIDSQAKDLEHQAGSSTDTDFSDAAKAKLRYIAGACIHKISSRLRQSVIRSLGKSKTCKFSSKFNYCKQNLLKQLQIQETDMAESTDQDSFAEIEFRQGASRGLRIVNDSVFNYFLKLNSVLQVYMSPESFHLHGEKIHIVCRQGLGDNEDLLDEWIQLFSNTLDDTEDEVFLSLLLDLYSVVNEHFVRIALLEGLHTFKTLIPRKKKQALRQKLQALGEKKTKEKGEKRKMPTPEVEEDDDYLCKECATVCEWEPSSVLLESLACDVCNSWYHYKCVGLKGNETFLKKSNSKWLCVHCKSSKGKGKGKGRGKGKRGK